MSVRVQHMPIYMTSAPQLRCPGASVLSVGREVLGLRTARAGPSADNLTPAPVCLLSSAENQLSARHMNRCILNSLETAGAWRVAAVWSQRR